MLDLALTPTELAAYIAALRDSHRMRVIVEVLDRNEKVMHSLDLPASRIEEGAVTVDAMADITRSLGLVFLDEKRALTFDAASPAATGLFADNMLAVRRGAFVPELDEWIDAPVFWGPVTKFERDGGRVTVEAQGKEALGLDPHFVTQGYTLRKGRRCDDAITDVMDRTGERRYSLPSLPARLPRARAVQPEDEPWNVVKFGWQSTEKRVRGKGKERHKERVDVEYNGLIALVGNAHLFYDGLGRLTARRRSTKPVFTFKEGRDLQTRPRISYDALVARNHVVVTGAKVTRGKKPNRRQVQMRAAASLPAGHPMSAQSLGRNGKPRRLVEFIVAENLKTNAACETRARRVLNNRSRDGLSLTFEALPMPFLEELDTVTIATSDYQLEMPLQRFTIPLTADALMTVGWDR